MLQQRCNAHLCRGSIAAWIRYSSGFGDLGSVDELREAIGPFVVEAVICAEVHDDTFTLASFVNRVNERLADAVGESHDPAVYLASLFHAADVVGREILIDDFAFRVALELLASKFARGYMAEIHVWMIIEDFDESLRK